MPTLILTSRYTEDSQALWTAAIGLGWRVERLDNWRLPPHLAAVADPVLYLEALFGPSVAEQMGVRLVDPPEYWLVRLPYEYRKRQISLSTLENARLLADAAFVKPPNDKSFPAQVYVGSALPSEYPDDMRVLISEIVHWEKEFRCFVLDRELVTFSVYSRHGELQRDQDYASTAGENDEVETFLYELLGDARVDLPKATVVDVGLIEGRGWACIEQNGAWGAGIYGCDPVRVLEVVRHATLTV